MSLVYYKFKNQTGSSVVDFDGACIAYAQLKRDIIRRSLLKGSDLKIVDEHTHLRKLLGRAAGALCRDMQGRDWYWSSCPSCHQAP